MEVTIKLEIDETVINHLCGSLGISDPKQLEEVISKYAQAATIEYHDMFLGRKVFRRGSDIMEYRLVLLTETLFGGRIPDESKVCNLFQMTSTESRSLLRSVISKYQHRLSKCFADTLSDALLNASLDANTGDYSLPVNNRNIVDALNVILADCDPDFHPIVRKKNTSAVYSIRNAEYDALERIVEARCNQYE
jgi:hypothetical protein